MTRRHSSSMTAAALFVLALFTPAPPVRGDTVEVPVKLPQPARLDMRGRSTLAVVPFLVVSREEAGRAAGRDVDVQKEFERYLLRALRRETDLRIIEPGPVDLPVYDLDRIARERDFWRAVGEQTGADLILFGGLDFDIRDLAGYRTEPYVDPYDGRTRERMVLVDEAGFEYDILLQVYDGRTGELLWQDNFKDMQSFEEKSADPLAGMFQNLRALEDRILNVFTQKEIEAARFLFTGSRRASRKEAMP